MAVTLLTVRERQQFGLHIDDIRRISVIVQEEKPPTFSAADTANEGFLQFEQRAGGFPRTGIDTRLERGTTLSVAERDAAAGQANSLTATVEGTQGVASDVANEILALLEERLLGIPETSRDVTQVQLP